MPLIEFATQLDFHGIPVPAKKHIPEWYKKMPLYTDGKTVLKTQSIEEQTYKRCVPFLDSLTTGYIAELWCDLVVTKKDNAQQISFRTEGNPPVKIRDISGTITLPVPVKHSPVRYIWSVPYCIKTPKNYSSLIVQPLNRNDLPFTTLSAIVDTDEVMYAGGIPFFLHEDFEGVIEKGTPIFQIIPFRREDWESKENKTLLEIGETNKRKSFAVVSGWYKKSVWKRKTYN